MNILYILLQAMAGGYAITLNGHKGIPNMIEREDGSGHKFNVQLSGDNKPFFIDLHNTVDLVVVHDQYVTTVASAIVPRPTIVWHPILST